MAQQQTEPSPPPEVQRRIPKQPECNIGTAGHVDSGKCLSWDSYVLLEGVPLTGAQIFEKVKQYGVLASKVDGGTVYAFQGSHVVSLTSRLETRLAESSLFVQRYSGPMYSIHGSTGREVKVTPEHPLLINRRGKLQWIKAKEILVGDYSAFARTVPLEDSLVLPDPMEEFGRDYKIVGWARYEELATLTEGFTNLSALTTDQFEDLRILLRLSKRRLSVAARIDFSVYSSIERLEKAPSVTQRARLLEAFGSAKPMPLALGEFLAERKVGNARRIRLLKEVGLDADTVKWFAFVWSEGTSTSSKVHVTQTVQRRMLAEFLSITSSRFGQSPAEYPGGNFQIRSKPFVDYLRLRFDFKPGNESTCGISDWVCRLPKELKALFLRWFFTLDGGFEDRGTVSLTQLNERNVVIVAYLLHSFGIVPRFRVKRSRTKRGMKDYSRLCVSGRNDLRLFAELIGFEDPARQDKLTSYLSRIEEENKESDLSIPVNVAALRTLFREAGITREGFRRAPGDQVMKEASWYHAYEDGIRKGRLSRSELNAVIATVEEQLRKVERSITEIRPDGGSIRKQSLLICLSLETLAAEMGYSRKILARILRKGSSQELRALALHVKGLASGVLHYASAQLNDLRRLARPSLEFERIVRIEAEQYDGLVFDLSVPDHKNFIAGKGATICHNTSLVQAITGVWASAHSEELKRGITIKVGYADAAFYKCPETPPPEAYSTSPICPVCGKETRFLRAVSFVDCPGHESLMTNMLAGAALMDGVILVITANEPVPMPQTREHLLALQMLGMRKMVVVQNKIDRVDAEGARKNYDAIKQFLSNTVGADAPVIPVSAQNRINIDALVEAVEENIPTPQHDLAAAPKMYILRSFDVNRPGADVKSLVGGVLGGSLVNGEVRVGDEIEISPGLAEERSGKYVPIATNVSSLGTGAGMTEKVGPGGLIALGTTLDPRLTKGDVLVGNMVGKPGSLPPTRTHITLDLQLFDQAVGSASLVKVDKVRATETLRLNIGTASSLGTVTSAREAVIELDLKKPLVAEDNARAAISRRIAERWRLIGSGLVR